MGESEKIAGNNTRVSRNTEPISAHAVSIRVPAFRSDKISLWFKQLEVHFLIAGMFALRRSVMWSLISSQNM